MRSKSVKKRQATADPIYKSRVVTRMINKVMTGGKKSTAQGIVYGALNQLSEDKKEAATIFEQAVKNVMPAQEVRSRRVGGATYQVPMPVRHHRSEALAIRWIVQSARDKQGKPMQDFLAIELKNAYEGAGDAMRKKEDTHKMAESNRAFSHFRF
jgi:small subunit ribosomal protein S7